MMKRKKKIILLTIIVVVGLSSILEFKKNEKNNIQAGKLKGYGTSEKAIKEYLAEHYGDAFPQERDSLEIPLNIRRLQ